MGIKDFDHELFEVIEELIDEGELSKGSAAYGVALQVVDYGYYSLSDKQKHVYDHYVVPLLGGKNQQYEMNRILNSNRD